MEIIEHRVLVSSRSEIFRLYFLGDVHLGKINCAEKHFKKMVNKIDKDPLAMWVGGGDFLDCITPRDPRWDQECVAPWIMENRIARRDVVKRQMKELKTILRPIKEKCVGLIEGNHEYAIRKHYDRDVQMQLAEFIDAPDLTDCAFIRFRFVRDKSIATVVLYICHGNGGGRTAGAEPNHLTRMIADKDVDIAARGHSHTYCTLPPNSRMFIPRKGQLPKNACLERTVRALNWGTYVLSYAKGPSTYESRAQYPSRPLTTGCAVIHPFHKTSSNSIPGDDCPKISIEEINLNR